MKENEVKVTELNVLWTTGDPVTSETMLLLYTLNAKKRAWFDKVNIIIWGASATLVAENNKIQALVIEAIANGVKIEACLHCADQLNVSDKLREVGVSLGYMGVQLSNIIKDRKHLITI